MRSPNRVSIATIASLMALAASAASVLEVAAQVVGSTN